MPSKAQNIIWLSLFNYVSFLSVWIRKCEYIWRSKAFIHVLMWLQPLLSLIVEIGLWLIVIAYIHWGKCHYLIIFFCQTLHVLGDRHVPFLLAISLVITAKLILFLSSFMVVYKCLSELLSTEKKKRKFQHAICNIYC